MTSSTPPPVAAPLHDADLDDSTPPQPRVRRFGASRAFALGLAALVGGYLAPIVLSEIHMIVEEGDWGAWNIFEGDAETNRRVLAHAWGLLALLAGLVALIGLAARRWSVGVLVLTVLSSLCHAGFVLLTLDTLYRTTFTQPEMWSPTRGLPLSIAIGALQLLVIVLCLVRGPVVSSGEPVAVSTTPPPVPGTAGTGDLDGDDRMAGPDDLATPAESPAPVAAPVVITEDDDETGIDDALAEDDSPEAHEPTAVVAEPTETAESDELPDEVFLVIHGQEYGPYPPDRVRGFMVEGRIHPGTLVRIGDETKPAAQVPSIFG